MRSFRPALVAGALALAFSAGTASAQFTNTYIFGDSLSDAGQYGAARSRPIPGLVTPMYVGQYLRLHHRRRRSPGGLDYAQGGARVNSPRRPPMPPACPTSRSRQQVSRSLAKGRARSERALPDPGRRQRHPSRSRRNSWAGRSRRRRCRRASRRPRSTSPRKSCRLRAAGAQYIVLQQLARHGQDAGCHRGRGAGAAAVHGDCRRRSSTRRSTRRSRRPACRSSSSTRRRC